MTIRLLDDRTQRLMQSAVQIQSPLTVLKELLDNAIDASATRISATLTQNGIQEIVVEDDGVGISAENLKILGQCRATTKPQDQQLQGFRGEALYVLQVVSRLYIQTRQSDESTGRELDMQTGQVQRCMCNVGTRVICRDIFHNIPVRQQHFIAQQPQINKQLQSFMFHYQLAFRSVRFRFVLNEKAVLNTQVCEQRELDDVALLYTQLFGEQGGMVRLDKALPEMQVQAYLSAQDGGVDKRAPNSRLFVIINGRPVIQPQITEALKGVFKERSAMRQPVGCLYLSLSTGAVDFNVAADKMEAKIRQPRTVLQFIEGAYREALDQDVRKHLAPPARQEPACPAPANGISRLQESLAAFIKKPVTSSIQVRINQVALHAMRKTVAPDTESSSEMFQAPKQPKIQQQRVIAPHPERAPQTESPLQVGSASQLIDSHAGSAVASPRPVDSTEIRDVLAELQVFNSQLEERYCATEEPTPISVAPQGVLVADNVFASLELVNQYNSSFLIAVGGGVVYLLDQHSLEEAIIFNELRAQLRNSKLIRKQALAAPQRLQLAAHELAALAQPGSREWLAPFGFTVVPDSVGNYNLCSTGLLDGRLLTQDDFKDTLACVHTTQLPPRIHAVLANRACKSSVRLGDPMSYEQQRALLGRAQQDGKCFNCPHGRPSLQAVFQ